MLRCPSTFKSSINNMNMLLFHPLTLFQFSRLLGKIWNTAEDCSRHPFTIFYRQISFRGEANDMGLISEKTTHPLWIMFESSEWPHCPQRWINSFLNHPEWQLFMFIVVPNEAWQRNILLEAIKMWGHCQPVPERQRGQSPLCTAVWAMPHGPDVAPPVPASICAPGNASKQYTPFSPGDDSKGPAQSFIL